MNDAAARLAALAERLSTIYVPLTHPLAVLLAGSVAAGEADGYSDLDLILYYEALPPEAAIDAARAEAGGEGLMVLAPRSDEGFVEAYYVDGVQCQLAHTVVGAFEHDIARVVDEHVLDPPLFKALSGILDGVPLHGGEHVERLRGLVRYCDELQRAAIEEHWRFFPLWHYREHFAARDAMLWEAQIRAEAAFDLVGLLAALNRVWFSSFQFKHTRALLAKLELAPPRLAERLELVVSGPREEAIDELERLVGETRALLREALPELELPMRYPPGSRAVPWSL